MAMIETPQRIDLQYDGRKHWFTVWRYETMPELHAALIKDGVRDFDKDTVAYTNGYPVIIGGKENEECGRMYLLDKSVAMLAQQASVMAFHLGHRAKVIDFEPDWEDVISELVGKITAELYSKSKYF